MYIVYALYSENFDKIYIGMTSNIEERFKSHNELSTKGWTKNFRPWKIIYQEECKNKIEALQREKQLKGAAGRLFIRSLIKR
jgi:putative endonuclease